MNAREREAWTRPTRAPIPTTEEHTMKVTIHQDGTYTTGEPFGPATPSDRPTVAERFAARRALDAARHSGAITPDEYWTRLEAQRRARTREDLRATTTTTRRIA